VLKGELLSEPRRLRKRPFFLISLRAETAIKLNLATEDFNKMREALIEIETFLRN